MPPSAARLAGPARVAGRVRRRKWDKQPTGPALVLIASAGEPIPPAAVSRAVALSGGQPVAVVSIARIYGYAMGLPNPGLLPTQKELGAQREGVARAIAAIERTGAAGAGQVAATRRPGRTIARVARARGARHVVLVAPSPPRWRRIIEGDLMREVRRRLSPGTTIETVTPGPHP
ncbi:MAG: hypothetical protein QOJ73_1010 [Streptosporangiaceae bacterium]|jgi:hypothetical protein|nr:hypothetical protein [Streptosporangiaceae bacterium]